MFIVIGTANVDVLVDAPKPARAQGDQFTEESPVFCDGPMRMVLGGNGANAVLVLARLGASIRLVSAIGCDQVGDLVHTWLLCADVDVAGLVQRPEASTSSTTIITYADRNRASYHHAHHSNGPR